MENRNFYPWFIKLTSSLSVYYEYVRRLNSIVSENKVPHKKRINDIQLLLVFFAESLLEADRNFLDTTQFEPVKTNCTTCRIEHQTLGMKFTYFAN